MRPEYDQLILALSLPRYLESLKFTPFQWQKDVLDSPHKRKIINGARQCGKSTIISTKPCHHARFYPGSLSLILAATERQAYEDMEKIKGFIGRDKAYPRLTRMSDSLIEIENGSRIAVVPATETSARGYSSPDIIILDESSRIDDAVFRSGIMPMLTDNEKCELIQISTPHGRAGFFFKAFGSSRWERYEVRAPWDVIDIDYKLAPAIEEDDYRRGRVSGGIKAYYSPRHTIVDEQQMNLEEMGPMMYRQEYLCEFVEPEDQVFSYEDIAAMSREPAAPLDMSGFPEAPGLFASG